MEGDAGVSGSEVGAQGGAEPRTRRGRRLLRITQDLSLITVIFVQWQIQVIEQWICCPPHPYPNISEKFTKCKKFVPNCEPQWKLFLSFWFVGAICHWWESVILTDVFLYCFLCNSVLTVNIMCTLRQCAFLRDSCTLSHIEAVFVFKELMYIVAHCKRGIIQPQSQFKKKPGFVT